jgi:phosphoserine phosphatase
LRTVACLIADPATGALAPALVRDAASRLRGEPRWLGPAAVEIATALEAWAAEVALREVVGDASVDVAAVPAEGRRKRLLIADMDSTMITIECIDELADFAGIKAQVAAVTARTMNGELDFRQSLLARVALLAGLPAAAIDEVCRERVRPMPGAGALVATMRAEGARCVLVSGGFTAFTRFVRERLGFDADEGNRLEVRDGRLTGRLVGAIRDAGSKREALARHCRELGITEAAALAVGDGANDVPMLRAAGLGVGFHAHPRVQAAVAVNVRHADLTALLHLQGYRRDEIVAA